MNAITATPDNPGRDPNILVRRAMPGDIPAIVELVADEEFTDPLTREQLHDLFAGGWAGDDGTLGYVVVSNGAIVGVLGTVHAPTRTVASGPLAAVSLSTLFVKPEYRRSAGQSTRLSTELLRSARDQGHMVLGFTAKGPENVVPRLLAGLGFEELSSTELFCPCGGARPTLLRPKGRVLSHPVDMEPYLDDERRRIVADHEPHRCHFYVVAEGQRSAFIVTKRRRYRGELLWPTVSIDRIRRRNFGISDVLHVSDPEIAARSWGRLVFSVCWNELTFGVSCAESLLGGASMPPLTRLPEKIFAYNRRVPPRAVDKLYSEVVLLP